MKEPLGIRDLPGLLTTNYEKRTNLEILLEERFEAFIRSDSSGSLDSSDDLGETDECSSLSSFSCLASSSESALSIIRCFRFVVLRIDVGS